MIGLNTELVRLDKENTKITIFLYSSNSIVDSI